MRISDVAAWTTCEAMALADPPRAPRVGVAPWVGTLAHAILTKDAVEPPGRLTYDAVTRSDVEAKVQARAIAAEAAATLAREGWRVYETEMLVGTDPIGHLDLLAYKEGTTDRAIIDLKTGSGVGAGWLQVGGYLDAYAERDDPVGYGGILHVARVSVRKEPRGRLEIRPGGSLVEAWIRAKGRIDDVLDGAPAVYCPGTHCKRCRVAGCPVRAD